MDDQRQLQGRGVIETRQDGREVPVFYTVTVERHANDGEPDKLTITGRVSVNEDPWLEALLVEHGRVLVLDDGRRLEVRVRESGRGSTTLPFRARPLDEAEFQKKERVPADSPTDSTPPENPPGERITSLCS